MQTNRKSKFGAIITDVPWDVYKHLRKFLFFIFLLPQFLYAQQNTIDSLQNVLSTAKEDTNKVNTLNNLAWEFNLIDDYDNELNYAEQAFDLSEHLGYKKGMARSLNNIGFAFDNQGSYPEALKNQFAALIINEEISNKKGVADSYNNIGIVYMHQGNYPEALKNHLATLKIREEIGDKKGIASSYNNIGFIYFYQNNYSDALTNITASHKIKIEIGDKYEIAISYGNIGSIYAEQHNYPEAMKNYLDCLKISEEIGYKRGIAHSYNNIGLVYYEQGDYLEALKNYLTSLKTREEIGDKKGIAGCYIHIGDVNIKLNKFVEAKKYLNDGLALSIEIGHKERIKDSYNSLSVLDSAEGNFKKAYEDYKMYIVYRDSLVNEENTKKTVQMQTRYEFEKEQIIMEQAALKQAQDEKERINRRNILQYTIILLFIMVVMGVVLSLGFVKVSERVAQGLIFVSLLLVFEFILVFMDPFLDNVTQGVPVYKLLVNVLLATCIFPVHSFLERRFKKRVKKLK